MTESEFFDGLSPFTKGIAERFSAKVRNALLSGAVDLETANMETVRAVVSTTLEALANDFKPVTTAGLKQRANLRHFI